MSFGCFLKDDPAQRERTEDAIIAWTWAKYMNSTGEEKNPEMLLYFPMVKVRKAR